MFYRGVASRYTGSGSIPQGLYDAWDLMRTTVYNNTNLTTTAVIRPIFVKRPQLSDLVGVTGSESTVLTYGPSVPVRAWQLMYHAASSEPRLWSNPSYQYDMVDVTRQVMANAFTQLYLNLTSTYNSSDPTQVRQEGTRMIQLLIDIDSVLLTNENFRLSTWIGSARAANMPNQMICRALSLIISSRSSFEVALNSDSFSPKVIATSLNSNQISDVPYIAAYSVTQTDQVPS